MGGKYQGKLKGRQRLLPVISALILVSLIMSVLDRAGVLALGWPRWTFGVAGAVTVLTTVANLITPSKPERALWGPVTVFATLFYAGVAALS